MRTGIYGGTFNPIHLAHIHLLREFARRLSLDRLILIPTGTPPHKAAHQLASGDDRLEMCRLASADITECAVEVSDLEVRREGRSYTADTLDALHGLYPQDELFLLMGEDMFLTVERWFDPARIFRHAVICAAPRDYGSFQKLVHHGEAVRRAYPSFHFIIQNIPYLPVSSTQVRACLESGASLSGLVPERVEQYIRERGLYQP